MTAPRKNGSTGTRNPANKKPTDVTTWKKKAVVPPVEMPSGNFMRIRKVGMQTLMRTGMMPNSLMVFAQRSVAQGTGKAKGMSDEEMLELIEDKGKVAEIGDFMDKLICFVAAEPEVHLLPKDGVDRNPELLYVDEVDEEDKMFVFQLVTGGTTDVESFRAEHSADMDAIRRGQDLELPAE